VRIKGRRRDKGGEGGRSKSAGWEDQPPKSNLETNSLDFGSNHFHTKI